MIDSEVLAAIPAREARVLRWVLACAVILFAVGISTPMITISKFVLIRNSFSVFSGVVELLHSGQILLFIVVATFSIVMPILKLAILYKMLSAKNHTDETVRRYLHLMHEYGRWAMLDVMFVAVLIATVKLGAIASIQVHFGLYIFGISVMLIMLITNRVVRLTTGNAVSSEQ